MRIWFESRWRERKKKETKSSSSYQIPLHACIVSHSTVARERHKFQAITIQLETDTRRSNNETLSLTSKRRNDSSSRVANVARALRGKKGKYNERKIWGKLWHVLLVYHAAHTPLSCFIQPCRNFIHWWYFVKKSKSLFQTIYTIKFYINKFYKVECTRRNFTQVYSTI